MPKKKTATRVGGARVGAGRRPTHGEPTVSVSVSLTPTLVQQLDKTANKRNMSRSQLVQSLLAAAL